MPNRNRIKFMLFCIMSITLCGVHSSFAESYVERVDSTCIVRSGTIKAECFGRDYGCRTKWQAYSSTHVIEVDGFNTEVGELTKVIVDIFVESQSKLIVCPVWHLLGLKYRSAWYRDELNWTKVTCAMGNQGTVVPKRRTVGKYGIDDTRWAPAVNIPVFACYDVSSKETIYRSDSFNSDDTPDLLTSLQNMGGGTWEIVITHAPWMEAKGQRM